MSVWSMEISAPQESDPLQNFRPPRRLPLGIPIKIAITVKIESARGTMGKGKMRELLLFSFPFLSCPACSLFLSSQPPRNTKRPLRRRKFVSGTWVLDSNRYARDSGFFDLYHGFQSQDSLFHKQNFSGLRNPYSLSWGDENLISYPDLISSTLARLPRRWFWRIAAYQRQRY